MRSQRAPLAVELSPEIENELLQQSSVHYAELLRLNRGSHLNRRGDRTLRLMALRSAFNDFNLDPDHSMVDIFELADEMNFPVPSRASTSTPEPQDLPSATEVGPSGQTRDDLIDTLIPEVNTENDPGPEMGSVSTTTGPIPKRTI